MINNIQKLLRILLALSAFSAHSLVKADGFADLFWENTVTGGRGIWSMKNGGVVKIINLPTVATQWRIAGAADFDGDGQADLVQCIT